MSHLKTILARVKRVGRACKALPAEQLKRELYPHLLNLAEYMSFYTDYEPSEEAAAERLLEKNLMPSRVDVQEEDYYHEVAKRAGIGNPGTGRCVRCGRALSNPASVIRGTGPVCAAKVERDFARAAAMDEHDDGHGENPRLDAFARGDA